jgi:hypothetical protein
MTKHIFWFVINVCISSACFNIIRCFTENPSVYYTGGYFCGTVACVIGCWIVTLAHDGEKK